MQTSIREVHKSAPILAFSSPIITDLYVIVFIYDMTVNRWRYQQSLQGDADDQKYVYKTVKGQGKGLK